MINKYFFTLSLGILVTLIVSSPWLESSLETTALVFVFILLMSLAFIFCLLSKQLVLPRAVVINFIILCLLLTVSVSLSVVMQPSLSEALRWYLVALIVLVSALVASKDYAQEVLIKALLLSSLLAVVWSFYLYQQMDPVVTLRRMSGLLASSNAWGGFVLLFVPLVLDRALKGKGWRGLCYSLFLGGLVSTVILSQARASWLAMVVGVSVVLFCHRFQWRRIVVVGGYLMVTCLALLALFYAPRLLVSRVFSQPLLESETAATSEEMTRVDTAFVHRYSLWRNSWRLIKDYPLFGIGLGNFGRVYHQYQSEAWLFATDPHNDYLALLTQLGSGGAVFVVVGGVYCLRRLKKVTHTGEENAIAFWGILLAVATHMLLENSTAVLSSLVILAVLGGIILANSASVPAKLPLKRGCLLLVIFMLGLSSWHYLAVRFFQKAERARAAGNLQVAAEYYQRSINLNPYQAYNYERLGTLAFSQQEYQVAKHLFTRSLAVDPTISEVHGQLAVTHYALGESDSAEAAFLEAITRSPYATPRYYNALARFYLEQGRADKALVVYEQAVANFPLNDIWFTYQHLYKGMNDELWELYLSASTLYEKNGQLNKVNHLQSGLTLISSQVVR